MCTLAVRESLKQLRSVYLNTRSVWVSSSLCRGKAWRNARSVRFINQIHKPRPPKNKEPMTTGKLFFFDTPLRTMFTMIEVNRQWQINQCCFSFLNILLQFLFILWNLILVTFYLVLFKSIYFIYSNFRALTFKLVEEATFLITV